MDASTKRKNVKKRNAVDNEDPKSEKPSKRAKRNESPQEFSTQVVRLRRSHGVVVQDCDVYIGRRMTRGGWNLPRSKWANPFTVSQCGSIGASVKKYREWIKTQPELLASIEELRGKRLGCWCKNTPSDPCHGDVLVELLHQSREQA